jgi:hypothetical protein
VDWCNDGVKKKKKREIGNGNGEDPKRGRDSLNRTKKCTFPNVALTTKLKLSTKQNHL